MQKATKQWSISELEDRFSQINFPEYQREPSIWSRDAKQRLIDSIIREFDVAPLYVYLKDEDAVDCVDGRQRIGAIMSFLGRNEGDKDNKFAFRVLNELYDDTDHSFLKFHNFTYAAIVSFAEDQADVDAINFIDQLHKYLLTIVELSDSKQHNEFNLQFARLNLGVIINSGEKLHAMVGDLRDACFDDLGNHGFLELTNMVERRFAREQTAAQILMQIFFVEESGLLKGAHTYTRMRNPDLQRLFKKYATLIAKERGWVENTRAVMNFLEQGQDKFSVVKSRALIVSIVLLAYQLGIDNDEEALIYSDYIEEFTLRLRWQVRKRLDADLEYRYLIDFQRHLTQASVEKPAITERAMILEREYRRWSEGGEIRGDREFTDNNAGSHPSVLCRE